MHLTLQLMAHLTMQSKVYLWISNLALYASFISDLEQSKQNCWHFQIGFHRQNTYAGKKKSEGEAWPKKCVEVKQIGLFQRAYYADGILAKDSAKNISAAR